MTARPSLRAPWRAEYLEGPEPDRCIFCEPAHPQTDRERLILHRTHHVFALLNRYPYSPGHLMVAPYAHVARLSDLSQAVQTDLISVIGACQPILERAMRPDGLNIGANIGAAAGAGFADHVHVHVVPRWEGDTNFMTVVGETRVLSKDLERTYDELVPHFAELGQR